MLARSTWRTLLSNVSRNWLPTARSSQNGMGQTLGFTVRAASPSAATTQFISLIRAEHESLSSAPMAGCSQLGAAKARATDSLTTPPQSQSIPRLTERMSPTPICRRIQVFDSNGKFLSKWLIPERGQTLGFEDLAVDSQTGRLYSSSAHMNSVLIFDFGGTRIGSLMPKPPDKLEGPLALALSNRKLYVLNRAGNRVSAIDL